MKHFENVISKQKMGLYPPIPLTLLRSKECFAMPRRTFVSRAELCSLFFCQESMSANLPYPKSPNVYDLCQSVQEERDFKFMDGGKQYKVRFILRLREFTVKALHSNKPLP